MKCPKDGARLACYETRPNAEGTSTFRRLKCPTCGEKFHTEETYVGGAKPGRPIYGARPHVHELRRRIRQMIDQFEVETGIVNLSDADEADTPIKELA